jgi:hypothetical protein
MRRNLWALGAAVLLSSCAGASYAINECSGVTVESVSMPEETYRNFDKPSANKMMVTPSILASAAQGAGQGLLLNAVDNTPPKPLFERAYCSNTQYSIPAGGRRRNDHLR